MRPYLPLFVLFFALFSLFLSLISNPFSTHALTIFAGDVSSFAPEDKRHWLETVLGAGSGLVGLPESETTSLLDRNTTGTGVSQLQLPRQQRMLGEQTWREALLYLRTMFPGAGNYSGVGLELDDAETAMFWRIADMRDMLAENSRRGAAKALAAKAREMGRTGGDRDRVEASALSASLRASLGAPSDDFAAAAGAAAGVAASEAINVYATRVLPAPADDEDEDEEGARD